MKNTKLNFRLLSLLLLLNLSIGNELNAQTHFIREYNLNYSYTSKNITQQNFDRDGDGFIFGGPIFTHYEEDELGMDIPIFDLKLVKINADGSLEGFTKNYTVTPPGGESPTATFSVGGVIKVNAFGGSMSQGYLMSGVITLGNESDGKKSYGALVRTDLNGNILWKKRLYYLDDASSHQKLNIADVIQVSSGKLILVGSFYAIDATKDISTHQGLVAMRINPNSGAIEWHKEMKEYSNADGYSLTDYDMTPNGVMENNMGEYFIYGQGKVRDRGFIVKILDGGLVPVSIEIKILRGQYDPVGIAVMNDELLVYGHSYIHDEKFNLFLFKMDNNMNNLTDLEGVANQATSYHTHHTSDVDFLACDILINNGKIVLSGLITEFSDASVVSGIPFHLLISPTGEIINSTYKPFLEDNDLVYYKKATHMFNATDSYLTTDKTKEALYRLTSRATDGNTCDQNDLTLEKDYIEISLRESDVFYVQPSLKDEYLGLTHTSELPIAYNLCENCDLNSEDFDPITTNTGSTTFCHGQSVDLTAPAGFTSYEWFRNGEPFDSGNPIAITEDGVYSVMCYIDECEIELFITMDIIQGCFLTGLLANIPPVDYCSIRPDPEFVGWVSDPLAACEYSYFYNWKFNDVSLPWTPGGNFRTEFIGPGTYTVTIIGPCGTQTFTRTVIDELEIFTGAPEANFSISGCSGDNVTFTPYAPPGYNEYVWEVYNVTTGAYYTVTTLAPTPIPFSYPCNSGQLLNITLTLISYDDCEIFKNTQSYYDGPGFIAPSSPDNDNNFTKQMSVYPNPASDFVNFELSNFEGESAVLVIKDGTGKAVLTSSLLVGKNQMNIAKLANGVYSVHLIIDNTFVETHQIVVQH